MMKRILIVSLFLLSVNGFYIPLPPLPRLNEFFQPFSGIPPMPSFTRFSPFPSVFYRECTFFPNRLIRMGIDKEIANQIKEAVKDWRYDNVSEILTDLQINQLESSPVWPTVLDQSIPPDSFIEALMALTTEQKGHMTELAIRGDANTLSIIIDGLILSLPDEVQQQSHRFSRLVSEILCFVDVPDLNDIF